MDKAKFYSAIRKTVLGPTLEQSEVDGCEAILKAFEGQPLSHVAYALATAAWETNRTMQPVREAYWLSEVWRKKNLRYWPYYGRGYPQVTWEFNYRKLDEEAAKSGLTKPGEILGNLDLAMRPDIAAFAMLHGMVKGWFTGHTLAKHLPNRLGTIKEFEGCRKVINGTDKAHPIALIAWDIQDALVAGGWA